MLPHFFLSEHGFNKLPVFLKNETDHDIILPHNCVIVEISVADVVSETPQSVDGQKVVVGCSTHQTEERHSEHSFDFGTSLPEEWKDRATQKLSAFSDVFAQHDLDFGHATKVQRHIKLKDETQFKQTVCPIHPHDYEAVKKHLQTLLEAGIENQSPHSHHQ